MCPYIISNVFLEIIFHLLLGTVAEMTQPQEF